MRSSALVFSLLIVLTPLGGPLHQVSADVSPAPGTPTILPPPPITPGMTVYLYDILVSDSQFLDAGDFFVIYDFGPVGATSLSPFWTLTQDDFDPVSVNTGSGSVIVDQTDRLNVILTYSGPPGLSGSVGPFLLEGETGALVSVAFFGSGTDVETEQQVGNLTTTLAPGVPEPSSLLLLGIGLAAMAAVARRRTAR